MHIKIDLGESIHFRNALLRFKDDQQSLGHMGIESELYIKDYIFNGLYDLILLEKSINNREIEKFISMGLKKEDLCAAIYSALERDISILEIEFSVEDKWANFFRSNFGIALVTTFILYAGVHFVAMIWFREIEAWLLVYSSFFALLSAVIVLPAIYLILQKYIK